MKHSTQLIRSLLGLTVLLASCQVDDSLDILSDSEAQLFVSEACNYYEQTISEAAEKSKLVQNKNMSPGEVTLCWHKAHIKQDANYEYVYVPIIAGNNYIRRVKIGKEGEKKKYRIPISQTLCVRRDKTGNYDAAYVTIVPSLNYYRANKSTFTEKVIHDKSLYGNLSGYVVYNNIVSSKMIVADRVKSGKCLWSYSPATFKDKALSRKIKKEIFQNIHNIGMSLTRNTINGGWLEEVTITPDGEDDDDDDEDYFCGFCAEYVPYGHICSEDEEVEEIPSGGGVWGGGGGSPGGGSSGGSSSDRPSFISLPSFSTITEKFKVVAKMEPIDVAKLIGGKVLANFQGNPAFVNGCTVRLSYALNMCGGSHKIPFSYEKTISGDADRNNQKEWYYYKVADIIPYLDGKYGTHQTVTLEDIKGKTGIIGQTKCEGWGAGGHVDIWDGTNTISSDHPYYQCENLYFWNLK